jgi:hypothetical protein
MLDSQEFIGILIEEHKHCVNRGTTGEVTNQVTA